MHCMMLLYTSAHNSFESKAEFIITIFFVFIIAQKNNCVLYGKPLNVLSRDYCKLLFVFK